VTRFWRDDGFTLVEMLVASAILLAITGAIISVLNPLHAAFGSQLEVSDEQQRLRAGVDALTRDLMLAGAGVYAGPVAGSLDHYVAPIVPYRVGSVGDDPDAGIFYRSDTISVMYVPAASPQVTIRNENPSSTGVMTVNAPATCPYVQSEQLCGFEKGTRGLVINGRGQGNLVTITGVQVQQSQLQYVDTIPVPDGPGRFITHLILATYYLKSDIATNTYQLMHYDGYQTSLPVVDDVVKLEFEYYADPEPPRLLSGILLDDPVGSDVTYGPKPPPAGADDTNDSWGTGENCTFALVNGRQMPRLPVLSTGAALVRLLPEHMTDGPWCPDEQRSQRFDADLLRIRRVRVRLRVQATVVARRGPAGTLFSHGGTARDGERYVPDQEISFDIAPRNLNLGR